MDKKWSRISSGPDRCFGSLYAFFMHRDLYPEFPETVPLREREEGVPPVLAGAMRGTDRWAGDPAPDRYWWNHALSIKA
jgi:hypothetical protein